LVIVFLAAIALHFYFKKDALEKSLKTVLGAQRTLVENVSGETIADPKAAYPRMSELFKLAAANQGADLPITASAREAWRDLYLAIQKFQQKHGDKTLSEGTLFLEIESVDIQQTTTPGNESLTMMMRGKIRNLEFASLLKNEVRGMPLFVNADFVGSLPTVDNDLKQFTLKATK